MSSSYTVIPMPGPEGSKPPKVKSPLRPMHWPKMQLIAERVGWWDKGDTGTPHDLDAVVIQFYALAPIVIAVEFASMVEYEASVRAHGDISFQSTQDIANLARRMKALESRIVKPMREREDKSEWEPLTMYLPRLLQGLGVEECWQMIPSLNQSGAAPIYLYVADLQKEVIRRLGQRASSKRD